MNNRRVSEDEMFRLGYEFFYFGFGGGGVGNGSVGE